MQGFTSIVLIGMLPGALTLTSPFCFECFVTYVTVLFCLVGFIYRIAPNFRGTKFSRISLLQIFAEINFADQGFPISHAAPLAEKFRGA